MSGNAAPIIIKRKKVIGGDGHHGGAWKVAYADFVTAMMAFFLLMWLLNATTEKQRKGIADYFSPTIAVTRISGGGSSTFGGDSVFTEESLAQNGTGASSNKPTAEQQARGAMTGLEDTQQAESSRDPMSDIADILLGTGGDAMEATDTMRHIATRLTDEGLVVEIFDLEGAPLFKPNSDVPSPILQEISALIARVFSLTENDVAVAGHTRARALVVANNPVWDLSSSRAQAFREMLSRDGLSESRVQRITGHADRQPVVSNTMDVRNNRIEVTLLRSDLKDPN